MERKLKVDSDFRFYSTENDLNTLKYGFVHKKKNNLQLGEYTNQY